MKSSSAARGGIAVVIFVLAVGAILQWRYSQKLRDELTASRNELAQAREESAHLRQGRSNATTEAQSAGDHKELLRLRNRIAELGRELRSNITDMRKSTGINSRSGTNEGLKTAEYPFLKTAVTNRVPNGQTLVLGGWTSPTGKRAFVFATPLLPTPDALQQAIHLDYLAVTADDSFWERVGWGALKSDGDNSVAGLLTVEQAEALVQALKQTKEAEVSNRVQASLVDGDKATFGWATTDGHSGDGSTLLLAADILARPTADRQSIDLEFRPAP